MNDAVFRRAIAVLVRIGLGGLLVVAGALKLRDPAQFALEISNYQLLPAWAPLVAVVLPATEVVTGAALIVLPLAWRRPATVLASLLVLLFLGAVLSAYTRGIDIACGCFGGQGSPIDGWTVLRNIGLLLLALSLFWLDRRA